VIDSVPRWSREVAKLRAQTSRVRRNPASKDGEVAEAALETCESLLRDLAGAQLECERLQAQVRAEAAAWERLFEVVPRASLLTDGAGIIVTANAAAGALLNVSPRHLTDRQLLVFTRDRDAFRALLQRLGLGAEEDVAASLAIRPRERRVQQVDVRVVPLSPDSGMWLWFLSSAGDAERSDVPGESHDSEQSEREQPHAAD
jgi:PAS domain-containing protein